MKIKSILNVITNSSSETFIIRTRGKSIGEIYRDLSKHDEGRASGEGGMLEIYNCTYKDNGDYSYEPYWNKLSPDFAFIDIDWAKKDTIKYLKKNYDVLPAETEDLLEDDDFYRHEAKLLKDYATYYQQVKEWYDDLYANPEWHKDFLKELPNPKAYADNMELEIKNWLEKHPTPIIETLTYED